MGLFPLIVAAALLPALFVLIIYFLSFARPVDDPEIKARRRWRMISRANAVWMLAVVLGLILIARIMPSGAPAAAVGLSWAFIVASFTPYMLVLGVVDRRIRGVVFPLTGYIRFQYAFLFSRWSSFLIVVALLYCPLSFVDGAGAISYGGIALGVGGAALFVWVTLVQMKLVGRLTGMLTTIDPDQEPARQIGELAARAGVEGVRVSVMETFGYPFYNAFASTGRTIYVTRPLLSALDGHELAAVAVHEIGHLKTMKKRTILMLTLLTACVVAVWFLVPRIAGIWSAIGASIFQIAAALIIFLVAILSLGAVSRRFEAQADKAAAELMGGTEKVISALEKMYTLNMIPRRFNKKGSENASHPSLERRVAVLRGESLPPRRGRVKRILFLLAGIVIVLIAMLLLYTAGIGGISANDPDYQYSWVDVIGPLEFRLADDPDNFELLKRLAVEYFFMEEDDRAIEKVDRALAHKRDPGLLMLRGLLLHFRGDRAGALSAMENAYREGRSTVALKWAAIIADEAGDRERARNYITGIAAIRPDDPFIREMKERPADGMDPYPFVGYWVVFQRKGAVPSETMPISPNDTKEE